MVDHAIGLTDADRGWLLEPAPTGGMRVRLARQRGARSLPTEGLEPSQTAIRAMLDQHRVLVTEDVEHGSLDLDLKAAQSIIAQQLRFVVVIPLYTMAQREVENASETPGGELLGVLYLDSRQPAAFSGLEREILDALAVEAASVIDNARLVERERERQRMEQELTIARDIQQALLPREFPRWPHLQVSGINQPCLTVGGDYFDVMELDSNRTALIIADVSGKWLGAPPVTTMLQSALTDLAISQHVADLVAHVDRFLCAHSRLERYATVFFGILDTAGRFEFINAGHPSPLILPDGTRGSPFPADA